MRSLSRQSENGCVPEAAIIVPADTAAPATPVRSRASSARTSARVMHTSVPISIWTWCISVATESPTMSLARGSTRPTAGASARVMGSTRKYSSSTPMLKVTSGTIGMVLPPGRCNWVTWGLAPGPRRGCDCRPSPPEGSARVPRRCPRRVARAEDRAWVLRLYADAAASDAVGVIFVA